MGGSRSRRQDGWTAERQLRFLDALSRTRSVTAAARAAGMSRAGAHRLRGRDPDGLFAALWDIALAPAAPPWSELEGHIERLSDGRLARLLGHHYRRESGTFFGAGAGAATPLRADRTRTL